MALDQLAEVADQRYLRLVALLVDLVGVRLVGGVDPGHDRFRPTVERRFVLARYAEQRADDLDGQRVREVVDDVDLLPIAEPGDEVVDERRDLGLAFGHSRRVVGRAELAHRDTAQAVVIGRVPSDERRKTGWWQAFRRVREATRVGADARVVEQRTDLPVRAHHVRPVVLDRDRRLAEPGVDREGIVPVRRVRQLVQQCLVGHGCLARSGSTLARISSGSCPLTTTGGAWYGTDGCGKPAETGPSAACRSGGNAALVSICRR